MNKKIIAGLIVLGGIGISSLLGPSIKSSAEGMNFVSIGVNVTDSQKGEVLNYFNKQADYPKIYKMNYNDETYGKDTGTTINKENLTSAYVEKTAENTGLNIKATNLTKVTASMLAEIMPTAGVYNGNIVVAAPKGVSGTDAVGAIDSAYSCDIGQTMPKDKEKLANEELKLMIDIEQNQSNNEDNITALFGNIKYDVVEKDIHDKESIDKLIDEYAKKYNVNLSNNQKNKLSGFMQIISIQNYYKEGMKSSLTKINNEMNTVLGFSSPKSKGIFSWLFGKKDKVVNIGIIGEVNDSASILNGGVSTASSSDISNAITKSVDFNKEVKEKYKDEPKETEIKNDSKEAQNIDGNKEIKSNIQDKESIEHKQSVEKNENKIEENNVKKANPQKVESNAKNIENQSINKENQSEKSEPKKVENKPKENVETENSNSGESGTITFDSRTRKVILHDEPGSHTNEIEHLDNGQKVQILGQSGHYYKVKTDSGNVGYVYDRYVH